MQTSAFAHYPVAVKYSYEIVMGKARNVKKKSQVSNHLKGYNELTKPINKRYLPYNCVKTGFQSNTTFKMKLTIVE